MRFVIRRNDAGQYWFVLRAIDGETLATSAMHPSRAAARRTISLLKRGVESADVIDQTGD